MNDDSSNDVPTTVEFPRESKIERITLRYSDNRDICAIIIKPRPDKKNHDIHEFWEKMNASPIKRSFANHISLNDAEKEWHAVEKTPTPSVKPRTDHSASPRPGVVAMLNETADDYPWNYFEMHHGGRRRLDRHKVSRHSKTQKIIVNMGNDFDLPNHCGGHTLEKEYHGKRVNTSEHAQTNGHVTSDHAAVITNIAANNLPNVAAKAICAMCSAELLTRDDANHAIETLRLPVNNSKMRKAYLNQKKQKYTELVEEQEKRAMQSEVDGQDPSP